MKPKNNLRLTPFIVGFVLIGVGCAYFFTSISQHASSLSGFILITTFFFGIAYYINEMATTKLSEFKKLDSYNFIKTRSNKRVETLEHDVDNLSEIVRDLAYLVDGQQKKLDTTEVGLTKLDFTLFLRPASNLTENTIPFYEALTETRVTRQMSDESRITLLFQKSEAVLQRLLLKNPTLKIMINVPFTLIENGFIEKKFRKNRYSHDYILNIEGIFGMNFTQALAENMKTLSAMGAQFCLTESAPLPKIARLKTLTELNALGVQYLRASFDQLEPEGAQKHDFDQIFSHNIQFIADDLDDTVDPQAVRNLGITMGQGPKIGIARPVKADYFTPNNVTEAQEYRMTA